MTQDFAETIGIQALAWLAGHDELLPVFMGATGISLADLRAGAGSCEILVCVLDFICQDDIWITDFATSAGLRKEDPYMACQVLSGAAGTHWT